MNQLAQLVLDASFCLYLIFVVNSLHIHQINPVTLLLAPNKHLENI